MFIIFTYSVSFPIKCKLSIILSYVCHFRKCFPIDPVATFICCHSKFMRTNFQALYNHYRVEHYSKIEQVMREEDKEAKLAKIQSLGKSFLPETGHPESLQSAQARRSSSVCCNCYQKVDLRDCYILVYIVTLVQDYCKSIFGHFHFLADY